ncbi:unnamed protein product [Acanthoscelides obtectus]|uniref:Uncharacterized protein n=1 Tax=Acanthoscelides obtectus TaxID=200917 RepID=A0A9P0LLN7_ACAOB|nr:unnamed protein product [Acanthoscelides obtectus]CAK1621452.1 Ankyrin-1 [Acanthoscelides obtectus]
MDEFSFMDFDLLEVARNSCFSVVDLALENLELYDFSVDSQDENGNTLLHYAAATGNLETANKLITLGAYTNILNNKGQTPLHVACLHAQLPIAELLVKNGANINVTDFSKETPVFKAVRGGNKNLTKFILSKGAIVNRYNKINEGLLHLAVMHDDIELVKLLLDNEEDPNELTNAEGTTPLHLATELNDAPMVSLLIDNKAYLNMEDMDGYTPLHVAAGTRDSLEILKILTANGAKCDAKNFNGDLPIHVAAGSGNIEAFIFLYKKSESGATNKIGLTATQVVEMNGDPVMLRLLAELDRNNNSGIPVPVLKIPRRSRRRSSSVRFSLNATYVKD